MTTLPAPSTVLTISAPSPAPNSPPAAALTGIGCVGALAWTDASVDAAVGVRVGVSITVGMGVDVGACVAASVGVDVGAGMGSLVTTTSVATPGPTWTPIGPARR
ncbi:MAG: hypothetical protein ACR2OO_01895 [Thermomicrobiales bacterium]